MAPRGSAASRDCAKTRSEAMACRARVDLVGRIPGRALIAEGDAGEEDGGGYAHDPSSRPGSARESPHHPEQDQGEDPDGVAVRAAEPREARRSDEAVEPPHHGEREDPGRREQGTRHEASPSSQVAAERGQAHPGEPGEARQAQVGRAHLPAIERSLRVRDTERCPGGEAPAGRRQQQLDGLERVPLEVPVGARLAGEPWPRVPVGGQHVGAVRQHRRRRASGAGGTGRARGPSAPAAAGRGPRGPGTGRGGRRSRRCAGRPRRRWRVPPGTFASPPEPPGG